MIGDLTMLREFIPFLANPTSHVLTLLLGMGVYHFVFARPERRRSERLEGHIEELFELQRQALGRIIRGDYPGVLPPPR